MKKSKAEIYVLAFVKLLDFLDKHNFFSFLLLGLAGMWIAVTYADQVAIIIGAFK